MAKEYLDYAGLKQYDAAIKQYISDHAGVNVEPYDDSELREDITNLQNMDTTLVGDLNTLKALVGNTAVADQINAAIAAVINGAPEAFDTLKEISDWISTNGEAASDLVSIVADQGEAISAVDAKVDAINAISGTYIDALFLTPVELQDGQTVQEAIEALNEGEKLVLTENVAENLTIDKDAVIEAEDVVFSGTVSVDQNAAVTIIGASFAGEVIVL